MLNRRDKDMEHGLNTIAIESRIIQSASESAHRNIVIGHLQRNLGGTQVRQVSFTAPPHELKMEWSSAGCANPSAGSSFRCIPSREPCFARRRGQVAP